MKYEVNIRLLIVVWYWVWKVETRTCYFFSRVFIVYLIVFSSELFYGKINIEQKPGRENEKCWTKRQGNSSENIG